MLKETVEVNQYWTLENSVACSFNRLKAQLFNLIEASVPDKTQQTALKGLIKGFANNEYRICVKEMRYDALAMKLIEKESFDGVPESSEPLENRSF